MTVDDPSVEGNYLCTTLLPIEVEELSQSLLSNYTLPVVTSFLLSRPSVLLFSQLAIAIHGQ